jgi:predicted O-methyltransferase YrrM
MPTFTADYFSPIQHNLRFCTDRLTRIDSILEIGSHEGRSSCWMLKNMLSESGTMTCVDIFENSELAARFRNNINEVKGSNQTVEIMADTSYYSLGQLITQRRLYDFIYIDGDHSATGVLTDATMAFGLLAPNGIILFDDYMFDQVPNHHDRPKMSLDAFINMFINEIDVVFINYQVAIRKKVKINNNIKIETTQSLVTDDWFENGAFPTFECTVAISYNTAVDNGTIDTPGGPVAYTVGDKIILGPEGEKYPVTPIEFDACYHVDSNGTVTPKKIMKTAKLADHDGVLHASRGNLNYTKDQDYIVKHGPGDYVVVKKDIFAKRYDTSKEGN